MLRIVPLAGPLKGQRLEVPAEARLGRDPACDIRLVHRSVSRRHARIELDGQRWWLVDEGSRNGLFLDKQRSERIELRDGLLIRLGDYPIRIEMAAPPTAQSAPGPGPHADAEVIDESIEFLDGMAEDGIRLDESDFGDHGLALEDPADIELGRTDLRPVESKGEGAGPGAAVPALSDREIQRAAMLRGIERDRSGLLRGDLSQYPGWVQAAVWIGVIGIGGALAVGAALLVSGIG